MSEEGQAQATEVTDIESAAVEIERRMTESESLIEENQEPSNEKEKSKEEPQEGEQEETEEAEEKQQFHNVEELADALEMDVKDFLDNIKVKRKIDGVEEEVSLSELRDGNQREQDYRRKTTELANQRREFDQQMVQARQNYESQLQEVNALQTELESEFLSQYDAINWQELELTDREEWLVQKQKYSEDYSRMQVRKQAIQQRLNKERSLIQDRMEAQQQQHLAIQNNLMLEKIPQWSDNDVRKSDMTKIAEFLQNDYGYSQEEINSVSDHRLVMLVRDAMIAKGQVNQADVSKKKVIGLPKILKPNAKKDQTFVSKRDRKEQLDKFRKSGGTTDDLAALLVNRI